MSTDDFEPNEYENDYDDGVYESDSYNSENIKEKYDRYKEKYDNYKEKYEDYKSKHGKEKVPSNDLPQSNVNNDKFRRTLNQARDEQFKNTAKEGVKKGAETVGKETGKELAKEGAKVATKEGTKAAVEAGTAATGVGAVVAVAIEAIDQLLKKIKKLRDKELREQEKEKKKKRTMIIIIVIVSLLLFPLLTAGPFVVVSEETTATLEQIIANREKRYTETLKLNSDASNVSKKTLMMFTDDEYRELLFTNYDKIEGSNPTNYSDPSYNFTIKNNWGTDIINFFASSEDLKDKDEYEVATNVVGKIIESEKNNFNKIEWNVANTSGSYNYDAYATFTSLADMKANDVKPSASSFLTISPITDLQKIPYTELMIPNLSTYNIDPTSSNSTQKAYTYAQAVEKYVQNWYIPYTMMIDTQDKKFILNEVMEKMYHPIEFTLYGISKEVKNTTTQYYLQTTVTEYWETYIETETIAPDDRLLPATRSEIEIDGREYYSNTKESTVGVVEERSKREKIGETVTDENGNYVTKYRVTQNKKTTTTLTDGGKIAYNSDGTPMVKAITVTRSIYPSRYIPKITHAETFYEVINATYNIIPIDESTSPRTSKTSNLIVSSGSVTGEITLTETWEESISSGVYESKPYQVSYYSEADLARLNKKVSRVEWYQDWGDTEEVLEAIKNGNTGDNEDLEIGPIEATSENMKLMLEQAVKMISEQYWTYNQGGDRGVCYSLNGLYNKKNIDCSAFVSSLYNIFLGVNPGSWTGEMKDFATAGKNGLKMYTLNSVSELQPGDILWRKGHVGLYMGNGVQIDAGGPEGTPEPNKAGMPKGEYAYTHYIRYTGTDFSDVDSPVIDGTTGTTGGSTDDENTTELSTVKGIIYPAKTMAERVEAYKSYGNGKGYSYDDMYFAYYQIESRLLSSTNKNSGGTNRVFGGFVWPVEITEENPETKRINTFFGYTPAYGSNHTGIDISTGNVLEKEGDLSKGAYVVAAHDGTVTRTTANPTSDSDGYTFVNIETTDGAYTTQYGHLSEIYVSEGDLVEKGTIIGRMGTTGNSTGVHLHFSVTDSEAGKYIDPLTFYNIANSTEPETVVNIADIEMASIVSIPTAYIYHSSKSSGLGFSVVGTVLSRDEWVTLALNYANGKSTDACFQDKSTMEKFYDTCVERGVNPEYAFATAVSESNLRNSVNNYWGLGTPNGAASAYYGDMLTTLSAYCDTIVKYQDPASSKYAMIMQRYEERKAVTENGGADPNGYGTPDTLQGIQSIYSHLGDHVYGDAGTGGFYYMDPARAGVTKIYSTHEEFVEKCLNGGPEHAEGTITTVWEQAGYTAWQSEKKIEIAKKIFGDVAGTY